MDVFMEDLSNVQIGTSPESFQKFLNSQRDLFRSQIDQMQKIVVMQCKLTGVNPLSQEMAAGALSIKIGKRPRDLLNPKAVKYMQTMFSIKDALGKKESREISALFGVKVTQVRDFFNSQRSRVRKFVRLSREKSMRSNSCKQLQVGGVATNTDSGIPIDTVLPNSISPVPSNSDSPVISNSLALVPLNYDTSVPLNSDAPVPLNSDSPFPLNSDAPVPLNSDVPVPLNSDAPVPLNPDAPVPLNSDSPVPLNTLHPGNVDDGPSCSTPDSDLSGIDGIDRQFVQSIFGLMRNEETFSGQVKLMEWILQIQNSAVLCWFLTKGGAIILATWLSEAATEEQTSLLHVVLEVLCHLPLHKALPVHISAILQSVNKLRFYRTSDISNRARLLLSRWSKLLTRSQTLKKPNGMKPFSQSQTEIILKQSIGEIMGDESWQSNIDIPENVTSYMKLENTRKLQFHQPLKLLPASSDDLNRKNLLGLSSSRIRERRKVQMVEQPEQKTSSRSLQVPRASPVSQGRPMSTDDIQKAKMRAHFLQSKYGKARSYNGTMDMKSEGISKPPLLSSASPPAFKISPQLEHKKTLGLSSRISNKVETPLNSKSEKEFKESLGDKCRSVQIQWRAPPEMKFNDLWSVGAGENSKEVEVQKSRNSREREIFYQTIQEIPSNPKEPWDFEMDYDDSLTPEILTEQLPDNENSETEVRNHAVDVAVPSELTSSQDLNSSAAAEPDLELLAVLLKNPELVFALTSGQAGNLPAEETVKLLDMIKAGGACSMGGINKLGNAVEKVEVSLPSPTPSSNAGTSGWKPAAFKNPFSQRDSIPQASPPVDSSRIAVPRVQANNITPNEHLSAIPATVSQFSLPQTTVSGIQPRRLVRSHPELPANTPSIQLANSDLLLAMMNSPTRNPPLANKSSVAVNSVRFEGGQSVKHPVSLTSNTLDRMPISYQSPPSPTPATAPTSMLPSRMPMQQRHSSLQPYLSDHLHQTRVNISLPTTEKSVPSLNSWRQRQDFSSHYNSPANQNENSSSVRGGSMQPHLPSGSSWGRKEYVSGGEFESWSPENSPVRIQEYRPAPDHKFPEPRIDSGRSYGLERPRQRSPYGFREQNNSNRHENRRWRDHRQY